MDIAFVAALCFAFVLLATTASEAAERNISASEDFGRFRPPSNFGDDVLPNYYCGTRPGYPYNRRRSSTTSNSSSFSNSRIIGGKLAKHGQFPWHALVSCNVQPYGGGVLISKRAVLTTAHIVHKIDGCECCPGTFFVALGILDYKKKRHNLNDAWFVEEYAMHPEYNDRTSKNDLALLFLNRSVPTTGRISPACLPTPDTRGTNLEIGQLGLVSGWGRTAPEGQTEILPRHLLKWTVVQVGDYLKCRKKWAQLTGNKREIEGKMHFCSKLPRYKGKSSVCRGDSGGAFVVQVRGLWFAMGVASFGYPGCASPDYPDGYAGIRFQIGWIGEALRKFMKGLNT